MSLSARRGLVLEAEQRLARERARLHASVTLLDARFRRHGPALVVGAGVVAGAMAGRLPWRALLRIGRRVVDASLLVMRMPSMLGVFAAGTAASVAREHDA